VFGPREPETGGEGGGFRDTLAGLTGERVSLGILGLLMEEREGEERSDGTALLFVLFFLFFPWTSLFLPFLSRGTLFPLSLQ